ncbi:MAG TPA: HAMP domain-containing sensor histidine kinase [Acidimicrobiales bacterium]|nr:HAMP domain-containing sensor histidine kinase [Acidimicrobiales bacterium]
MDGDHDGPKQYGKAKEPALAWLRQVSFRGRVSILVGAAVGIAVALAALVSYVAVGRQLERQATTNLDNAIPSATGLVSMTFQGPTISLRQVFNFQNQTGDSVQVITKTEVYSVQSGQFSNSRFFPMSAGAAHVLKNGPDGSTIIETVTATNGDPYQVASVPTAISGVVVQIGYPLTAVDNTLSFLRLMLILVALGGVAVATGLGWAVGRASIRPVEDLTLAAEHVAATQDLSATIDDEGNDELARLARSFNAMLAALALSRRQQTQLVSDAGHELRTPLTSLRTNIEVLMRTKDLPPADRDDLLADVDAQLKELTTLVGDLVDMAREDERPDAEPEPVPFNQIVERAVERAHRRAQSLHFDVALQPGDVRAQPALLERAVMNVLDNAAKWSPPGGHVGVTLQANSAWHLTVTDQGPGIAPEDLPHIFERFYRAESARSMPGSGLGLAIVRNVVTAHGGSIDVTSASAGGGTRVDIFLPLEAPLAADTGERDEAELSPGELDGGLAGGLAGPKPHGTARQ